MLDRRAAKRERAGRHAAVVVDDDLLDDGQPQAGAARARREERLEHPRAGVSSGMPGPLSSTDTRHMRSSTEPADAHRRRHTRGGARLGGVANQVAEHLPQQHLVAVHAARTCPPRRTSVWAAARGPDRRRRAARHRRAGPRAANAACVGPRELQEVGHHVAQRLGFLRGCRPRRAGRPPAARRAAADGCSRESSPGRSGTRARCRRSARPAAPALP